MKKKLLLVLIILLFLFSYQEANETQKWLRLVLQVNTDDAINIETDKEIYRLREYMKKMAVGYKNIVRVENSVGAIILEEFTSGKESQILQLLGESFRDWDYSFKATNVFLSLKQNVITNYRDMTVQQTSTTIKNRLEALGLKKAAVQRSSLNTDRLIVEIPMTKSADPERVKNIIATVGMLEFKLVLAGPSPDTETLLQGHQGKVPEGMQVIRSDPKRTGGDYYLVDSIAPVTGKDIKKTQRIKDEWNNPAVAVYLLPDAGRRFSLFTSDNIGKQLAIILDGKVQLVASIQQPISDSIMIWGRFTAEEAEDIALILRIGALPASITYLEEKVME